METLTGPIAAGFMCAALTWLLQQRPPFSRSTTVLVPITFVLALVLLLDAYA